MRYLTKIGRLGCLFLLYFLSVQTAYAVVDLSSQQAISPSVVDINYLSTQYNRRTGQATYNISLTNNSSDTYSGPFSVLVSGFPNTASLVNADDVNTSGEPVMIINADQWATGADISLTLIWTISRGARLNFNLVAYAPAAGDPPVISSFTSSTNNLTSGQAATLSWQVSDADSVELLPGIGSVDTSGSLSVSPTENTTYSLVATNSVGETIDTVAITVIPRLSLQIRATPDSGDAPITIRFTPLPDTFTAINRYRWDFNGDGVYDRTDTVGRDQTFTYNEPGVYSVGLEAVASDSTVQTAVYELNINNAAPEVNASVDVTNGEVPLTVSYSASATDRDGIESYEWDFNNDGIFDFTSSSTGNTTNLFSVPGNYQATLRVTDRKGASTEISLPNIEIRALPAGSPTVTFTPSLTSGTATLFVRFNAQTTTAAGVTVDSWEWDFDGDGIVDSNTPDSDSFNYTSAGTYFPELVVTTSDGGSARDIRRIDVTSSAPSMSRITQHTINTDNSETSTITTRLFSQTRVQLQIEDSNNNRVNILIPWEMRSAGTYDDVWDGTDAQNQILPEDQYYAVLLYGEPDNEQRVDLRDSTGGRQYNPSRSRIPRTFSPFDNDPLDITYTLNRPSEVTAFMGLFNTNTRLVTFLQREPLGAGSYTIYWNGDAPNGQTIPPVPGNPFLFGIWGWELADNVIFIRNAPQISGVTILPGVLDPTSKAVLRDNFSHISLNLSKDATIELVVSDVATGSEVAHRTITNQTAGDIEVLWDGKGDDDEFLAPGEYRIGVRAVGDNGARSMFIFGMQRIYY